MEYKYKVVRSYGPGSSIGSKELQKAFDEGYEFIRASEFVEGGSGYIEYILRKQKLENN